MGLCGACKAGNMELAKYFIEHKNAYETYGAFNNACLNGNLELVQYIFACGINNPNWGLFTACLYGHLPVVKFAIECGANDFQHALEGACQTCQFEIVKYLIEIQKVPIGVDAFVYACTNNHLELVQYLIFKGATFWNDGLINLSSSTCDYIQTDSDFDKQVELAKLLISHSNDNESKRIDYCESLRRAMQISKPRKKLKLVKLLITEGNIPNSNFIDADETFVLEMLQEGIPRTYFRNIPNARRLFVRLYEFRYQI